MNADLEGNTKNLYQRCNFVLLCHEKREKWNVSEWIRDRGSASDPKKAGGLGRPVHRPGPAKQPTNLNLSQHLQITLYSCTLLSLEFP